MYNKFLKLRENIDSYMKMNYPNKMIVMIKRIWFFCHSNSVFESCQANGAAWSSETFPGCRNTELQLPLVTRFLTPKPHPLPCHSTLDTAHRHKASVLTPAQHQKWVITLLIVDRIPKDSRISFPISRVKRRYLFSFMVHDVIVW